ncbi:hypothetical protein [Nocardioides sediminis]|uniref:hypothetical protein n=1 Tax=Nocardioides sediminis TaxID=433648 RepID=UPI00131EE9FB|nr:hypothetical protein [Nocardioides sediminis]
MASPLPSAGVTLALAVLVVPGVLAGTLVLLLVAGPLAFLVPTASGLLLVLYRTAVRTAEDATLRVLVRELGAVVLAPAVGFGTWMALTVLGILVGVLPFIDHPSNYPHADAWGAASAVVAFASAAASWWLLRRFADPAPAARR